MNSLATLFQFTNTAEVIHTKLHSNLNNERVGKLIRIHKHDSRNDREKKGNDNKMEVDKKNAEVENLLLMDAESVNVMS